MNPTQPDKLAWLIGLALFWALHGLAGRDAWRAEEALALGAALDWLHGSQSIWVSPAPLFTLAAGLLAKWAPAGIEAQDAARLASAGFTLAALLFTGLAAHTLYGRGFGAAAVLALMGALGLMLRAHALTPEVALLAAWSLLFWGVMLGARRSGPAAVVIALSLALLAMGLRGLPDLVAAVLLICLPLLHRDGRTRIYRRSLYAGLILGMALILATLAWLALSGQFDAWLAVQRARLAMPLRAPARALADLVWFAWPLWPLALAAVWHQHRRLGRSPEVLIPFLMLLVLLAASVFPAWSREGGLLPALAPMALLASYSMEHLRRGATQAFYWFGVLCFVFFAGVFWVYFSALEWNVPVRLAAHLDRLNPAYLDGSVASREIWIAAVATVVWFAAIPLFPRARTRPILVWATGMVLVWTCIAALFGPWIEANFAYRPLVREIQRQLPAGACLDVRGDKAMAVMVGYHTKIGVRAGCPWTLTRLEAGKTPEKGPAVVWEGRPPRQKKVIYRLEHHGVD